MSHSDFLTSFAQTKIQIQLIIKDMVQGRPPFKGGPVLV